MAKSNRRTPSRKASRPSNPDDADYEATDLQDQANPAGDSQTLVGSRESTPPIPSTLKPAPPVSWNRVYAIGKAVGPIIALLATGLWYYAKLDFSVDNAVKELDSLKEQVRSLSLDAARVRAQTEHLGSRTERLERDTSTLRDAISAGAPKK